MPTPASGLCHRTCGAKFCAPCGTPRCGVFVSFTLAAEDGGPCVASATGPPRSGFHGVAHRATSSCFNGLPTGSLRHMPQPGKRHADGVTHRCGLRPPQRPEPCFALVLGLLILHTRARKAREAVSVLVHGPSYYSPAHRPSDPARFRVFLSSRAKRGRKQTPHRAPGEAARCRHVAHAARIAMPSALQAGRPVRRAVMSPLFRRSRRPPLTRPRAPFKWSAVSRKATSEPLPRDRPRCRLYSGPGIRYAGYPDRFSSHHSAAETRILPRRPRSGLLPQSRRRDLSAEDPCAKADRPCSFPSEKPHPSSSFGLRRDESGMLAHLAPRRTKCTAFGSAAGGAIERLPYHGSRQQRGDGHSRSYSKRASPRVRQPGCSCTLCRDNRFV